MAEGSAPAPSTMAPRARGGSAPGAAVAVAVGGAGVAVAAGGTGVPVAWLGGWAVAVDVAVLAGWLAGPMPPAGATVMAKMWSGPKLLSAGRTMLVTALPGCSETAV